VSAEAVFRQAGQVLAPYKRPKRVLALDSLPRSDLGKVATPVLVSLAQEDWTSPPAGI
jgi:acyl-CoA synthetase (AMP-forming)/AMP-acid ligase II